jgi:hypothetical protein
MNLFAIGWLVALPQPRHRVWVSQMTVPQNAPPRSADASVTAEPGSVGNMSTCHGAATLSVMAA